MRNSGSGGECVYISIFTRVYRLQPGPFFGAGLPVLGSFLFPSPLALLPGSMLDGVRELRSLTAGPDD
ncbi:MAG: hypothetical protein EBS53_11680 [Bacteroidetes bacterium]|nr:hypothetical protein [Bacteroidota bacterium]